MNADRLLELYDRVADAPDAIDRLRRFVLDLAVRGKLVEQNPADDPASELLEVVATERKERIKRGEIRRGKPLASIDDAPFDPPSGWAWIPLGETGNIFTGNSINAQTREHLEMVQEGRPFIATKDVGYGLDKIDCANGLLVEYSDERFKIAQANSVLICAEGGSAGRKTGLTDREICFGNKLLANETWSVVSSRFVLYVYLSDFFYAQFSEKMTGVIGGISIRNFLQLPFPFPPLAEQNRIVAKVDELMALLDQLDAARAEREATRDRLTAASLTRLTAPDTDAGAFPAHARFALDVLPAFTARPDQIKQLRQTILDLAVRGKLVEQDQNEEAASEFLDRLHLEHGRKQKKSRNSPTVRTTEMPFECPPGWAWAQVRQILAPDRDISYGVIKLGPEPKSGGISTLRCSDVRPGFIDLSGVRKVEESIEADYARTRLEGGEIVINIRGTLGGVALVPDDLKGHNVAREVAVIPIATDLSGPFLVYLMLSPYFWEHIQNNLRGIAYKGLNLGILRDLPLPLPPLAEQHRIVAKIDALMALCDQLESTLANADTTRQRLLEALLHEVLTPSGADLEAAE